jgi:carbon-monoxide dehydrogenase large subunit
MGEFAIGQSVPRTEDPRLLRGGGRFVDDVRLVDPAHAVVLRSPHAHARIVSIDTGAADAMPGVLAVLTGADYEADGLGGLPCQITTFKRPDGGPMFSPPHPALARDRVRRVGDDVALVVAESTDQAKDAAERIVVDYAPLPSVSTTAEAAMPGAPVVWDDCPDNICFRLSAGDRAAVEAGMAGAAHVVRRRFVVNRVSANTMEPRGCIGHYDAHAERYTIYVGLQNPHEVRRQLSHDIFPLPETSFRIVPGDIGGSFGMRGGTYPEYVLALWASRRVGRPVKWISERSEGLASDDHARDNVTEIALALDGDGLFLALDVRTTANMGAYLAVRGPRPPTGNLGTLAGVYRTPAAHVEVTGVFTNTNSFNPYRGSGGPEAGYVTECLIDDAARLLDLDAVEIRRRNLIADGALPYTNALGYTYDSGAFERLMETTLDMADRAGFDERRAEAERRGRRLGFGIANAIKKTSIPVIETARVRFDATGTATVLLGTISHGQGHETMFKQVVSDRLGLAAEDIRIVEGDTDLTGIGGGTFGSRSAALGGTACVMACDKIIDKGKLVAAHLLEASTDDIAFEDGMFAIAGTDRAVGLGEVASAAFAPRLLAPEIEPGLDESASFVPAGQNWASTCHACEAEVDPETGVVVLTRYVAVTDVGTVINPLMMDGQNHGGIAQTIGQALTEEIVYEPGTGQLLTGSFMDYCMPRADDMPSFELASAPVPTELNPLGVKGGGEIAPVACLPAVLNAVVDALAPEGVDHVELPATPERVWRAINSARRSEAP